MIITRAPFRISFFGGGTDHPEYFLKEGGAVLATAIDKFSYVTANPFLSNFFDYGIRISYSKVELAKELDDIEHNVFRECLKLCGFKKDIALHNALDLPSFSGLGSSSSLVVSTLHALHSFKGEFLSPIELARKAIYVEKHLIKDNVGCQDQVMAAFGGFNLVEFRTEKDIAVHRVPISPKRLAEFEKYLVLVYTKISRSASEVTAKQLKRVDKNMPALRALKRMAYDGYDILTSKKPLKKFGQLLGEAWQTKRSLDGGVSNKEIDDMYKKGLKAGAWGGKLLGAGGGGFLLFFADPTSHKRIIKAFPKHEALHVKINAPGAQIIFS
ncbi:MAG: GHMP kinase [Candidatus Taylorbacteria bacterium RIFCSPHIGHO2_01_FULL_45_63]|uniref:GHMP kinase n=1 Tax=Candidatus Taylorbacteria bacterium RIFCSPHIGHO2_02_FULL_45_35 TaxID=1802311 RepID=A0A1G2MST8_9BACT|nr:MAG: GHMP kinase [Candidatus Taylorbacteria bacterium RIFCSPHIGHO2_01_FULL_45_63]OHA26957.1 MAG: GHMP kinase [Candidatus Taylorbacteria bacterium RIFCSPHIGHO2_02_FULL_45_35]OHA33732.1 MAG: GHMP kinase [Candidatus Taylorbacteria bacterium RIFCSPLOWO2_01_FULL_45_34b]